MENYKLRLDFDEADKLHQQVTLWLSKVSMSSNTDEGVQRLHDAMSDLAREITFTHNRNHEDVPGRPKTSEIDFEVDPFILRLISSSNIKPADRCLATEMEGEIE